MTCIWNKWSGPVLFCRQQRTISGYKWAINWVLTLAVAVFQLAAWYQAFIIFLVVRPSNILLSSQHIICCDWDICLATGMDRHHHCKKVIAWAERSLRQDCCTTCGSISQFVHSKYFARQKLLHGSAKTFMWQFFFSFNFGRLTSAAQTWTGNVATVLCTKLSSRLKSGDLPGVLRLLMKEFFGVASSSSKSNSVGVGGLRNKDICISDTFSVVDAE